MEKKYYDSAFLSRPRVKSENAPNFKGTAELSEQLCAYIVKKVKAGETPKIDIGIWEKENQYGEYFSCKLTQGWDQKKPQKEDDEIPF